MRAASAALTKAALPRRVERPTPAREAHSCELLAIRAQQGSADAFEALVERLHAPLYNFLYLRTGSAGDAEELTQEAFLRAWQKLGRYDSRWRFSTWLYTLAGRLAASHQRSSRRHRERQDDTVAAGAESAAEADPSVEASRREESDNIWRLAGAVLTESQRSALWLRYAEERSIEEIARILRKRPVSVRGLLFRAREKLAGYLETDEGSEA